MDYQWILNSTLRNIVNYYKLQSWVYFFMLHKDSFNCSLSLLMPDIWSFGGDAKMVFIYFWSVIWLWAICELSRRLVSFLLCVYLSLLFSTLFSACISLFISHSVISISSFTLLFPSLTCFCFSCLSQFVYVSASLSSDRSCWVFLLSHEVSSYGNPFISDTQTCTRTWTLLLFTCHPV